MKQLRKTIRNILLENQQHQEKLVNMILTGDFDSINQALELAQALGLATDLEYRTGYTQGPLTRHIWEVDLDPELEEMMKKQHKIDFKSGLQIFYGKWPARRPGSIKIQLYV